MKLLDRKGPPMQGAMVLEDGILPDLMDLVPSLCVKRDELRAALELRTLIHTDHL